MPKSLLVLPDLLHSDSVLHPLPSYTGNASRSSLLSRLADHCDKVNDAFLPGNRDTNEESYNQHSHYNKTVQIPMSIQDQGAGF